MALYYKQNALAGIRQFLPLFSILNSLDGKSSPTYNKKEEV